MFKTNLKNCLKTSIFVEPHSFVTSALGHGQGTDTTNHTENELGRG